MARRRAERQSQGQEKGDESTLSAEVRAPMERAYGQSFGDVKVHPNSPRASGSVHALAEGNDLHFAPGKFNPGTQEGNWLVAHELAHVVQQRGGGMATQAFDTAGGGLLEQDADRAADKAVRGESAAPRFRATAGTTQMYESWEHNKLGEAGGGGRTITTKNGVVLSYGQAVALSGDFYATPEALMNAPKAELEKLLATMKNETAEADNPSGRPTDKQEDENNAKYQDATEWREDKHYDETGHDTGKTEGETQGSDSKSYLSLADDNSSHFSPNNIQQRWRPQHEQAMAVAQQAFKADQDASQAQGAAGPDGAQGANANGAQGAQANGAQGANANGQDANAQNGAEQGKPPKEGPEAQAANQVAQQGQGQQQGQKQGAAPEPSPADVAGQASDAAVNMKSQQGRDLLNQAQLHNAFGCHFITDAFASGHLISGDTGRQVGETFWSANQGRIAGALKQAANADNPHVPHQAVDTAINGVMHLVQSHAGSLCLKLVHDKLNETPLTVTNPRGDTWATMGDGSLAGTPGSQQFAAEAVALSRRSIEEMASSGKCAEPEKAIEVVPHLVAFQGNSLTIEQFATNPAIFQGFLEPLLLDPSPKNPLYLKIKGNLGLAGQMAGQKAHQAGQAVAAAGKRAKSAVTGWVDSLFDK